MKEMDQCLLVLLRTGGTSPLLSRSSLTAYSSGFWTQEISHKVCEHPIFVTCFTSCFYLERSCLDYKMNELVSFQSAQKSLLRGKVDCLLERWSVGSCFCWGRTQLIRKVYQTKLLPKGKLSFTALFAAISV